MNIICPYCGHPMVWKSDFNYEDAFTEGDDIVSYYYCNKCGYYAEISLKEEK